MPSPRFLQLLLRPEARRRLGIRIAASGVLGILLAAALACSSAPPPQQPPVREPVTRAPEPLELEPADRPYLIDPLEGYAGAAGPETRDRTRNAWLDLMEAGDTQGAVRAASQLLEADPDYGPAQVLYAQVDFAAGEDLRVVERLLPLRETAPGYTAGQLLLGRAAERLGDVPLAYSAYRAV